MRGITDADRIELIRILEVWSPFGYVLEFIRRYLLKVLRKG